MKRETTSLISRKATRGELLSQLLLTTLQFEHMRVSLTAHLRRKETRLMGTTAMKKRRTAQKVMPKPMRRNWLYSRMAKRYQTTLTRTMRTWP